MAWSGACQLESEPSPAASARTSNTAATSVVDFWAPRARPNPGHPCFRPNPIHRRQQGNRPIAPRGLRQEDDMNVPRYTGPTSKHFT
eukprot:9117208-Pyramimonas_sp.AAC.1